MNKIEFKVRFITPLLIHGANPKVADENGLTGKVLRGAWRFWFRAMVGGMVPGITQDKLAELEGNIFGSADENVGAKFRIRIEVISLQVAEMQYAGFADINKFKVKLLGYSPGAEFKISILPRKGNMLPQEQKILLLTVWLWANLGSVGQRARRGFGSPIILVENGRQNIQFGDLLLPIKHEFKDRLSLEKHIRNVVILTTNGFSSWLSVPVPTTVPVNSPFFMLANIGQIYVGKTFRTWDLAVKEIHGCSECKPLGWVGNGKMASPVYSRLHQIINSLIPVATWSQQNGIPVDCSVHSLTAGNGCVEAYMNNGEFIQLKPDQFTDGSQII